MVSRGTLDTVGANGTTVQFAPPRLGGDAVVPGDIEGDGMRWQWPLVGRSKERGEIRRALVGPNRHPVAIRGPSGVGKTRLTREVVGGIDADAFWVTGTTAGQRIPLGAFGAWADVTITDPLQRVNTLIATLRGPDDAIIVVDDLPRLDDLSLFVVATLIRNGSTGVLVTLRSDDPVTPAVAELMSSDAVSVVELGPLTRAEVAELLAAVLGAPAADDLHRALWGLSQGNPLYLRAIVEQARDAGSLILDDGQWSSTADLALPQSLTAVIAARFEATAPPVVEVIDVLTVAEPLPTRLVAELTGFDAVEAAERAGFVTVVDEGAVQTLRLAHPVLGEVRHATAAVRLHRLRGQIAQTLDQSEIAGFATTIRQALLALDADDFPNRGRLLVAGAEAALGSADLPLAVELSSAVTDGPHASAAQVVAGYALSLLGQGEAAEAALARAAHTFTDPADLGRITLIRAENQIWTLDDPDGVASILAEGAPARVTATLRAQVLALAGRPAEAAAILDTDSSDDYSSTLDDVLRSWAEVLTRGDRGRVADLHRAARSGYAAADSPDAVHHRTALTHLHAYMSCLVGDLPAASEAVHSLGGLIGQAPGLPPLWTLACEGMLAVAGGDAAGAARMLDRSLASLEAMGAPPFMRIPFYLERAHAAALAGDAAGLTALIQRLHDTRHCAFGFAEPRQDLLDAWLAATGASMGEAVAVAHAVAGRARDRGRSAHELHALHTAVRFGATDCADRLEQLMTDLDEVPLARAVSHHARALSDGDGHALDTAAAELLDLGLVGAAVDALAHAAIAHGEAGRHGARLSAQQHLARLADERGIRTPAVVAAELSDGLSARQREIVLLAQQGLTNREIAEKLTVSVRTVEGHRYRAAHILGSPIRSSGHRNRGTGE